MSTVRRAEPNPTIPIEVQTPPDRPKDIAEYAERKIRGLFRYSHQPVLGARIRLSRSGNPALSSPFIAKATLDVNGRPLCAQVAAPTAREAVDRLRERLRQRMDHSLGRGRSNQEQHRARHASDLPGQWRHGDPPAHRPPYFPRPPEQRQIIRHKSVTLARTGVDEAASDMEAMDFDFHLFTESGSGQDSVLYRAGPTGYRLAQIVPMPEGLAPHGLPLSMSAQPAPLLSTEEAVERMGYLNEPFLFYLDGERGRAALLYRRYDGHYGLITPAG